MSVILTLTMSDESDVIENPVTRERVVFRAGVGDPRAEVLGFDFHLGVGGGVFVPHMHLAQSETIQVRRGRLRCGLPGAQRELHAGDTATFEPGRGHTLEVVGNEPVEAFVEFRPAGRAESFLRNYFGLCRDGRCDPRGELSLLQVSLLMPAHDNWRADIPLVAQRVLFTVLRPIAWLLGYRAEYPRYAARPAPAAQSDSCRG